MTGHNPRNGQELNSLLANADMVMPHYSGNGAESYIYSNGPVPYTAINPIYPAYSTAYPPDNGAVQFAPENSQMAVHYQQNSSHLATSLSQFRTHAQPQNLPSTPSTQRYSYATRATHQQDPYSIIETEDQDS